MKSQIPQTPTLNSFEIMIQIMDDIEKTDPEKIDKNEYPTLKKRCTRAIELSIKETCERLELGLKCEEEFDFSEGLKKKYKKKYGIVDFIITNPKGREIAIELDSRNKRLSYAKLEELSERGYDTFWVQHRFNIFSAPYKSSYKEDSYLKHYRKHGYTNKNVAIIKHIFHPTSYNTSC